ncbi:MAG: hypothetical protein PHV32_00080 [Eubacteriales bacterium]|nr:hypothetical protein [Eubacteriales bacterium]
MKEKLKSLLKNKIFIGSVAAALVIAIAVTAILLLPSGKPNVTNEPETSDTNTTDTVPEIDTPDTTSKPTPAETEGTPSDISVDLNTVSPNGDVQTGGKADTPANPVAEKEPEKPADTDNGNNGGSGGITIGNPPVEEKYSCGAANHHCKNAEAHAYILNLELEGCSMCGSHSCPSFYGTDEWGNTGLFPTLCPKYNTQSDPLHTCQKCGKKTGDGSNGTCVEFINACNCPLCGESVVARTCHTCK